MNFKKVYSTVCDLYHNTFNRCNLNSAVMYNSFNPSLVPSLVFVGSRLVFMLEQPINYLLDDGHMTCTIILLVYPVLIELLCAIVY
jgi:hypothetical protein